MLREMYPFLGSIFWLIALLANNSALAQTTTIPVRGGEHDQFTRLVMQIPEENSWRVVHEDMQAKVLVSGPPLVFDLSQTFARIPRTRLRNVRAVADGLVFEFACQCRLTASEDIPQFLVIDIFTDAKTERPEDQERPRPIPRPDTMRAQQGERSVPATQAGISLARSLRGHTNTALGNESLLMTRVFGGEDIASLMPFVSETKADQAEFLRTEIQRELGQALARAVGSGHLTAADGDQATPEAPSTDPGAISISRKIADTHITVSGPQPDVMNNLGFLPTRDVCPEPGFLSFEEWAEATGSDPAEGTLGQIYNDANSLSTPKVISLASSYLARGFGVEGRMVLSILDNTDDKARLLRVLSYLIDFDDVPDGSGLEDYADCAPEAALWVFLADAGDDLPLGFRFDHVAQTAISLPPLLRMHIGPRVIEHLVRLGREVEAALVGRALDRIVDADRPGLKLARLQLDLLDASPEQMMELEAGLSPELSKEALLFLLQRREAENQPAAPHLLELAKTHLFSLRGSASGEELAALLLKALIRSRAFDDAISILEGRDMVLRQPERDRLENEVYAAMTDHASDRDFVTLTFGYSPWGKKQLTASTRELLAIRLDALGFALEAQLMRNLIPEYTDAVHDNSGVSDGSRHISEVEKASAPLADLGLRERDTEGGIDITSTEQRMDPPNIQDNERFSRARQAVDAARAQSDLAATDRRINASSSAQADENTQTTSDTSVTAGPDAEAGEAGLLERGRNALTQSATLREHIGAMISKPDDLKPQSQ